MELSNLVKITKKRKKRVGRGESSGKGKTAGRGAKGQRKREKVAVAFEGGQLPLSQRLPQRRGLGNPPLKNSVTITTAMLNQLKEGSLVDEAFLKKEGIIGNSLRNVKIKIVAKGDLEKPLKVKLPASKKAIDLIKKAGGSLLNEDHS
ncbi:MAG: 50S ribosomal protein L15 [Candidatus Omnitrophica bacterium]|nr:50S ribosomal protein L15 [Candidatus Omnitrophota bacterium]